MKQGKAILEAYNKTAKAYADQFYNELEKKSLDRILLERFAKENRDLGPILDLACGPGQTTQFLYQQGIKNITGLDLSPEMIKTARLINPPGINFVSGNMLALDFPANYFTRINCFYGIVHFTHEELAIAFQEIHRVLKPGGDFLFSFHVGTGTNSVEDFLGEVVKIDFYFFETETILQLLLKSGWQVKEVLERHPYEGAEYPSKRAYITVTKG